MMQRNSKRQTRWYPLIWFWLIGSVFCLSPPASGQDAGLLFYQRNKFRRAILVWEQALPKASGKSREIALRGLGLSHRNLGQFYNALFRTAVNLEIDYYTIQLDSIDSKTSDYTRFYLGICLFEQGQYARAATNLERFIGIKTISSQSLAYGKLWLGACAYKQGNPAKAASLWNAVKTGATPGILSELAYIYSRLGINQAEALSLCQGVSASSASPRTSRNLLHVYAVNGRLDQVRQYLSNVDRGDPEFTDTILIGKSEKVLRFYDPSMLLTLSQAHLRLAIDYFKQLTTFVGVARAKNELHLDYESSICEYELGDYKTVVNDLRGTSYAPALVYLGAALWQTGDKSGAETVWKRTANDKDPQVLRDLGAIYTSLNIKPADAISLCRAAAQKKDPAGTQSVRYQAYYRHLGRAYAQQRNYSEAVKQYAQGYDFSHRADIDYNDPVYMLEFGDVLYKLNRLRFAEITEMYLALREEFPASTQLHDMMQGIYAYWTSKETPNVPQSIH